MIDSTSRLPITRQCALLDLSRASYYRSRAPRQDDEDAAMKATLNEVYERHPYYGSRRMQLALRDDGWHVGVRRIRRMMRELGLTPIHPKRRTSVPNPAHAKYPYLLRNRAIESADEVWAADITYLPMRRGHVYLVAVMDWYSRRVLSWRLSTTLDASFCVEALKEALQRHGTPRIFNTDQGSQFTCPAFLDVLRREGIAISMDGQGCWRDNVVVERFWRSLKYECVFLHAFDDPREARDRVGSWIEFYNRRRPHQALGYRTPAEVHDDDRKPVQNAA